MSGLKILIDLGHPEFQVAPFCAPAPFVLLSSGLGIRVGSAAVPCAGPLDGTLTLCKGYPIQPSAFAMSNLPGTLFSADEDLISLLAWAPKHLGPHLCAVLPPGPLDSGTRLLPCLGSLTASLPLPCDRFPPGSPFCLHTLSPFPSRSSLSCSPHGSLEGHTFLGSQPAEPRSCALSPSPAWCG